jgi:circadian clock protein KaiB
VNPKERHSLRKRSNANAPATGGPGKEAPGTVGEFWELRLYVAGRTPRAERALANLASACELHMNGRYSIEVVDLLLNPRLARADQIVALPTLVRRLPAPIKRIIGDLSNLERMLVALELRAPGGSL